MLVLGVLLVLVAALLVLAAVFGGADDPAAFDMGPLKLSGLSVATVFLLGALTLLLLVLGIWLLRAAARRASARRKEQREMGKMSAKLEALEAQQARDREQSASPATDPATAEEAAPRTGSEVGGSTPPGAHARTDEIPPADEPPAAPRRP